MTTDTRVQDLLQRWHALRQHGRTLSAEELCQDCPELIDEVQRQLPTLESGRQTTPAGPPDLTHRRAEPLSAAPPPAALYKAEIVTEPFRLETLEVLAVSEGGEEAKPVRPPGPKRKKKGKRKREKGAGLTGYALVPFIVLGELFSWLVSTFLDVLRVLPPRLTGLVTMLVIMFIACFLLGVRMSCNSGTR